MPSVLIEMKRVLVSHHAEQIEGIFRLAGERSDVLKAKQQLNLHNKLSPDIEDANTVSTLLKIWFRELPHPLLNAIPPEVIKQSDRESILHAYETLQVSTKKKKKKKKNMTKKKKKRKQQKRFSCG